MKGISVYSANMVVMMHATMSLEIEMRSYQWLTEDDMGWSWTHSLVWSVAVMSMNTFLVSRVILESAEERGTDQGGDM